MKKLFQIVAFFAIAAMATVSSAQTWDETANGGGDAGNFPETSFQDTNTGTFDVITGNLDAVDQDAYLITIDSATWSADVFDGTETDTRLWLFNLAGELLMFNDDSSQGGAILQSRLSDTASFSGGDGLVNNPIDPTVGQQVVLVVNGFADDALDDGGVQLADSGTSFDGLHGIQAASSGIFGSWEGANQGGGTYSIQLTGASFGSVAVPEPTSLALIGFGAVGFLARRRRK